MNSLLKKLLNNHDALGEALREAFFDSSDGYGCYSTFKYNQDVEKLPDRKVYWENSGKDEDLLETWTCAKTEIDGVEVLMEYYWDGDGTLRFKIPSLNIDIINTDCKKDHNWRASEPSDDYESN